MIFPVPDIRIEGWNPGTEDYEKVSLVEYGPGWSKVFLLNVPLKQAILIRDVFIFVDDCFKKILCIAPPEMLQRLKDGK